MNGKITRRWARWTFWQVASSLRIKREFRMQMVSSIQEKSQKSWKSVRGMKSLDDCEWKVDNQQL